MKVSRLSSFHRHQTPTPDTEFDFAHHHCDGCESQGASNFHSLVPESTVLSCELLILDSTLQK